VPDDAAIRIEGVTKRFGQQVAVRDLDLVVPHGSICGFLGPNGAGKTTTIRMVMAILFPDEGSIEVLGRSANVEAKQRIGYLPEERGVYRKMKVGAFLAYIARLKGVDAQGLRGKIDDWLERVALPDVRDKRCEELSKGMQQKVQFLATIIHDPELIILDEPFSGLDPVNARLLRQLIDDLHAEGRTIIFSTHVLASADAICERIFMINKGRKVLDGPIDGVRARFDPKTIVVEPAEGSPDAIVPTIEAIEGVKSTTVRAQQGYAEAHLAADADPTETLRAIAAALPVRRVEVRRATLEDIFVELVAPEDSSDSVRASVSADAPMEAAANA